MQLSYLLFNGLLCSILVAVLILILALDQFTLSIFLYLWFFLGFLMLLRTNWAVVKYLVSF